ncbi:DUF5518 domain-containing protein [Natrinema thermotolerans]|uniref:DUF5518 domain-containing protein n=1 Tax=Natrinema thermotolerans TaxID=121872 RepID=A0AAF0T3Y8_9EURY|nr:DUF5518 domain-containing protein [Natrinema thermotolerans]QCC59000.1 hypothetical protein DVR14_10285 [Natrinema thermotolerans]WMT05944.1 DUF5518 domain-containing protein [Natrinema thermotolerans]
MVSPPLIHTLPPAWRFALIGSIASLPVIAVLNWLPNSEATIGGGIMIIGAFVAGVIAAIRSSDPGAAGLRAGIIGGALGLLVVIVTAGTTATWSLQRVVFIVIASGLVVCVAPLFGLGSGRVGGWVANTVGSRRTTNADAS